MNVILLKEVKAAILREPRQFFMMDWFDESTGRPNCGTAACIGGWAVTLACTNSKKPSDGKIAWFNEKAHPEKVLAITPAQADRLFYVSDWPEPYYSEYRKQETSDNAAHNADVAARRIDHFIATEGRE